MAELKGDVMNTQQQQKRIVVVLNEKVDKGRVINAAAHLALGFGASRDTEVINEFHLLDYVDAAGLSHPNISALSLVVLKANQNQLVALRANAIDAGLPVMD